MGCAPPSGKAEQHAGRPFVEVERCGGCGKCTMVCPQAAMTVVEGRARLNPEHCVGCGDCIAVCPKGAIGVAAEGLCLSIGGRSGRVLQVGTEAEGLVTEDEVPGIVGRLLDYFRENAQPGERLGELMGRVGEDEVFAAAGLRPRR